MMYDDHWDWSSIHIDNHPDMMLLAHEDEDHPNMQPHPYQYACIVYVFYAKVSLAVDDKELKKPRRMEFLWA